MARGSQGYEPEIRASYPSSGHVHFRAGLQRCGGCPEPALSLPSRRAGVSLRVARGVSMDMNVWETSADALVLGLGMGMVMQVLVLAVQNSVSYEQLGVATSGTTLFRSIGGALGVAAFGAIFAHGLEAQLSAVLPPGTAFPVAASQASLQALPPDIRNAYPFASSNKSDADLSSHGQSARRAVASWTPKDRKHRSISRYRGGRRSRDRRAGRHLTRGAERKRSA